MILHLLASFLIFLTVIVPAMLVSVPVVACMLLTKWDGYTTIFGNSKWGRANNHPYFPTKGYWSEFNWLVWRNPVNNLKAHLLAPKRRPHQMFPLQAGKYIIYVARMGWYWEYYWELPYGNRVFRLRAGWKLNSEDNPAFVFAFNPIKPRDR